MPVCQIHLMEGRSPEQKRALIANVTEAICLSVGAKPEAVSAGRAAYRKGAAVPL